MKQTSRSTYLRCAPLLTLAFLAMGTAVQVACSASSDDDATTEDQLTGPGTSPYGYGYGYGSHRPGYGYGI